MTGIRDDLCKRVAGPWFLGSGNPVDLKFVARRARGGFAFGGGTRKCCVRPG